MDNFLSFHEDKRVDKKKTRTNIKEILHKFSYCKLSFDTAVTSDWCFTVSRLSVELPFFGVISDSALEERRFNFVQGVVSAVNRLRLIERKIIIKRYLSLDTNYDYELAEELGLSLRTYERYKASALYNLAFLLGELEYKD